MAEKLRFVTLNAQHGTPDGNYKSAGDIELLAEECVRLGGQLLAVQELDRFVRRGRTGKNVDQVAEIEAATGMAAVFAQAGRFRGRGEVGHAIFVRGAVKHKHSFPLEGARHTTKVGGHTFQHLRLPRRFIIAEVEIDGYDLSVCGIHTSGERRQAHVTESATELLRRPGPHVWMGDPNVNYDNTKRLLKPLGFEVVRLGPTAKSEGSSEYNIQIDQIALQGFGRAQGWVESVRVSDHEAGVVEAELLPVAN